MAVVVIEDRLSHGVWFTEVGVLSRRIHKSAILIPGEFVSQPQNVIGSSRSGRQEHNPEARAGADLTGILP